MTAASFRRREIEHGLPVDLGRAVGGAPVFSLPDPMTTEDVVYQRERWRLMLPFANVMLDYVARKSSREGGVVLRRDPATGTLEIVATSYRKP